MRRVKKSVVIVTMMFFSIILFSMTNVHAANKKLKVNKVYTTTKKIKGKTKKKYLVKVKIGKKIYKKKASSKGNFTIPIPKQKVGKKLTVKAYRKKNKKWKLYAKKTIIVKKKTAKTTVKNTESKYPGKEDAIDLEQVKKDLATGKEISKGETALGKGHYYYLMNFGGLKGDALIGYVNDYIDIDTDGEYVTMKAINGAKLYYTVAGASEKSMTQLEEPTFNSEHLEPRQKVVFSCYDFNKNANRGGLYLKVHAYKNGKLIAISYESHYMIHMIPGFYY
ncbi:Uncharacterised protein [Anaerostipes hadrus]|uniref:Bacterial Ig domain-containing protein n=1 Tax=Anaerostipes hadrus TaxID=649756 RepID=A0A173UDC0_ANAHA|nr:hypothetical protein [Anaerostipes hadrus]CUN13022.1 Uncharacterised protein [Anaerostipes hadrus]